MLSVPMPETEDTYGHSTRLFHMQVGRDPRLSGPVLAPAIAAGMATRGASVARFGPATTPAMFMSCVLEGAHVII